MRFNKIYFSLIIPLLFLACENQPVKKAKTTTLTENFKGYWFQGKAEISSYKLEQARYGEIRKGEEILLFVTEDLSASKHQKLDDPKANPGDAVKVLKMNRTKAFTTGIYPYNMMNSVFTPVELGKKEGTLRSSTSSQEWCGHSFTLIDLWKDEFEVQLHSYFIAEGDTQFTLGKTYLEDAIFNRIRINPEMLPQGEIEMIPGSFFQRFKHTDIKAEIAETKLTEKDSLSEYQIFYPELERTLRILFESKHPYRIELISEEYQDGGQMLKTTATRKATIQSDYWNKNSEKDTVLRKKLLLK
ncbi:MAG: hypothetical protein WD048_14790 [Chitinophagales bacterium]